MKGGSLVSFFFFLPIFHLSTPFAHTFSVRGDEVLKHGQAFAEVRGYGRFDNVRRKACHQPPHARTCESLLGTRAPESANDVNGGYVPSRSWVPGP